MFGAQYNFNVMRAHKQKHMRTAAIQYIIVKNNQEPSIRDVYFRVPDVHDAMLYPFP